MGQIGESIKMEENKIKAVIYMKSYGSNKIARQPIREQQKICYKYAEDHNYTIIAKYIDYPNSRKQFNKMIDDSKNKDFDIVLVSQFDRFAINRYDSATYKYKFKKNGVKIVSAKEHITDDISGTLLESILEAFIEYQYSQKIKDSTK